MYCGNNRRSPELRTKRRGTRYECFRKGVGVGLSLPYDPDYGNGYAPIDNLSLYCGKSRRLPAGYDAMGTNPICLQKGVAIGKVQKAKKEKAKKRKGTPFRKRKASVRSVRKSRKTSLRRKKKSRKSRRPSRKKRR